MITRADIVKEAYEWVGTPYLHCGLVKGPQGGTDCAMLQVGIFRDFAKLLPATYDPRPYPMQWHLHRGEERFLNDVAKYGHQVTEPQVGDLALFQFGRCVSHSGIIVAPGIMVHAYREAQAVIVEDISAHTDRLHSYWSIFK